MNNQVEQVYNKIADLVMYGVPNGQIASVCGLSDGRITQILQEREFQNLLSEKEAEEIDRYKTMNDGWDTVENEAVASVLMAMRNNPDPDYALKAAVLANKANRRGSKHNKPIDGTVGSRAVVYLNQTFINKLQNNTQTIAEGNKDRLTKKDQNFLSPRSVEQLLQPTASRKVKEAAFVGELAADLPAFAV